VTKVKYKQTEHHHATVMTHCSFLCSESALAAQHCPPTFGARGYNENDLPGE